MNETDTLGIVEQDDLVEVIGVRFKVGGRIYYFDPIGMPFNKGEDVIIDTAMGHEYGECAQGNHMVEASRVVLPLRPVIRRATGDDTAILAANYEKEKHAFEVCQRKIAEHGLSMKLVGVEYSFDGSKILFFFTSDGRVDFRDLVKNLASVFRTRIELRQIGVRDEAKMLGGLGICGRQFCCSSFLDDFHPVSIKMAKTQNLSLNPTKISGSCGRLMCCLKYEQFAYEDMNKRTPKVESLVEAEGKQGTVTEVNLLKAQVKVRFDNEPETDKIYKVRDITVLRNGGKNKKETPILPPDPPILEDEPEEVPEPVEALVSGWTGLVITEPEEKAKTEEQKRRSRSNRNKNKRTDTQSGQKPSGLKSAGQKPAGQKPEAQNGQTSNGQKSTGQRSTGQKSERKQEEKANKTTEKANKPAGSKNPGQAGQAGAGGQAGASGQSETNQAKQQSRANNRRGGRKQV